MGIEPACECRRCKRREFYPWVWKIPWRKKWQPTSSILASKIPWTEEPGGLQSMGLQRLRHDWALMNNVIRKGKNIANDCLLTVFLSINWSHLLPLLIGLSTAQKPWSPVPPGSYRHFKRRRGLFSLSPKWNSWRRTQEGPVWPQVYHSTSCGSQSLARAWSLWTGSHDDRKVRGVDL